MNNLTNSSVNTLNSENFEALNSSQYDFSSPFLALDYKDELSDSKTKGYTVGCKWAPDGSCLLVASNDKKIRLFNLPQNVSNGEFNDETWLMGGWKNDVKPALTVKESEYIYDYKWYPLMRSSDRDSCCFAVTCRDMPIHLWDACSGQIICNYIHFNHLDQLVNAHSLSFSPDGLRLAGGFAKGICVFDVQRPGRVSMKMSTEEQPGIISSIDFHPLLRKIFAAGSFKSILGLYSLETKRAIAIFHGHHKGITHIQFSSDGTKLFSGTRKDEDIFCWDIRNPGKVIGIFKRDITTNQKMYFDLTPVEDRYLLSGTTSGKVLVWDTECLDTMIKSDSGELLPASSFSAHKDCVNGISIHPYRPLLATSSGQREIPTVNYFGSDSEEEQTQKIYNENNVKLWWIG